MDRAQLDALFAELLDDGTPRGHLYLTGFVARCPRGETMRLWPGGPRAEIYAVREMEPEHRPDASRPWRVLLNIDRAAWERWKRRHP